MAGVRKAKVRYPTYRHECDGCGESDRRVTRVDDAGNWWHAKCADQQRMDTVRFDAAGRLDRWALDVMLGKDPS